MRDWVGSAIEVLLSDVLCSHCCQSLVRHSVFISCLHNTGYVWKMKPNCFRVNEERTKLNFLKHMLLHFPAGTSDSRFIPPLFSSRQRNRAYWASRSRLQFSHSRGGDHEVWEDMWWHWGGKKKVVALETKLLIAVVCKLIYIIHSLHHRQLLNFCFERRGRFCEPFGGDESHVGSYCSTVVHRLVIVFCLWRYEN